MNKTATATALMSICLIAGACGTSTESTTGSSTSAPAASASDALPPISGSVAVSDERATPLDGLTDWLSWSDVAVVATITGDGLAPEQPTDEPGPEGSKTLLRDVHATVDEVVWTFPDDEPPLAVGEKFTVTEPTWMLVNGQRKVLRFPNTEHLEVGSTYVLFLTSSDNFPWQTIAPESHVKIVDDQVTSKLAGAKAVTGDRTTTLAAQFKATPLHKDIAALHDLPMRERVSTLMKQRSNALDKQSE